MVLIQAGLDKTAFPGGPGVLPEDGPGLHMESDRLLL